MLWTCILFEVSITSIWDKEAYVWLYRMAYKVSASALRIQKCTYGFFLEMIYQALPNVYESDKPKKTEVSSTLPEGFKSSIGTCTECAELDPFLWVVEASEGYLSAPT